MGAKSQLVCLWAGIVMIVALITGLATAGWVPPPVAGDSPRQVAQMYLEDENRIRFGVLVVFFTPCLAFLFSVVVAMHMRVRGRWTPWAFVQLGGGALAAVPTLVACFLWLTATYNPEQRTAGEIQLLHDAGWLNIVGTIPPTLLILLSLSAFIFLNDEEDHVFPRWVAYFSLWWALAVMPGLAVYFFDEGPLAWNGILTFWLAAAWVAVWYSTIFWVLRRAVLSSDEEREITRKPSGGNPQTRLAEQASR